jgi:hypothetical protein
MLATVVAMGVRMCPIQLFDDMFNRYGAVLMRVMTHGTGLFTRLLLSIGWVLEAQAMAAGPTEKIVPIDDPSIRLSPYVWKLTGTGSGSRAEAGMPGAYLKAGFQGSATIGLIVDGTGNRGCPASSMPVVEYSVDEGPFDVVQLAETGRVYTLPMGSRLNAGTAHRLDVWFRAADLAQSRWKSSTAHLRIAGLALDAGGSLVPCAVRSGRAIGFGDSITEGVGVDGLFTSWQSLGVNNARAAWFGIVCAALGCEYGQLGSGGQGMTRPIEMPPLPQTWDRHDPTTSRLAGGLLLPEPNYVFCAMGTNDFEKDITRDYTGWLTAVRKACPHARIFCIVPPLGFHKGEIEAAVVSRNQAGDRKVHLIDTSPFKSAFRAGTGATQLAFDGVHPSTYGSAMLAAFIAAEVQRISANGDAAGL